MPTFKCTIDMTEILSKTADDMMDREPDCWLTDIAIGLVSVSLENDAGEIDRTSFELTEEDTRIIMGVGQVACVLVAESMQRLGLRLSHKDLDFGQPFSYDLFNVLIRRSCPGESITCTVRVNDDLSIDYIG